MNKSSSIAFRLFLLAITLPAAALAQFSALQVSSGSAPPGGTAKIAVKLGPNASSGTATGFTLSFDPQVATIESAAGITRGSLIAATDHIMLINLTAGKLKLLITSETLRSFAASEGTLVEIQFRVPAGAAPGASTELRLSDAVVIGAGGDALSLIAENGSIQVQGSGTTTTTQSVTSTTRSTSSTTSSSTSSTRPTAIVTTTTTSTSTTTIRATTTTTTTASTSTTTTLRSTPEEPATVQTLSTDPTQGCPGFYIGDVSLAPGAADGMWGIEIQLTAGERLLQGGLNLGGGFQENGGTNGWGAFNIVNPRSEPQEVNVQVDAQPLDTPGYLPSAFGLSVRLVQRVGQNDVPVGSPVTGKPPMQFQRVVTPGFYILEVRSVPGSPRGTFQMAATTKFVDRLGGGFQGGVVVGGYLTRDAAGNSLHGYAAFCISESQAVSFQTYGKTNYPGVAAGNLLLTLKDRNQQVFWQSPIPTTTTTTSTTTTTRRITTTTTTSSTTSTTGVIVSTSTTQRTTTTTSSTTSTTLIRTTRAGTLTRNETWTPAMSPILLTDDVTVPAGITLTIQPGVDVLLAKIPAGSGGFDPTHTELLIAGVLVADAGSRNSTPNIKFYSDATNPLGGDWAMILIHQTGNATFRNVRVSHGIGCLNVRDRARAIVEASRFQFCGDYSANAGGAIIRSDDSSLEVRDSLFMDNLVALFFLGNRLNAGLSGHNNSLNFNRYGVLLTGASNPTLTGNDISNNLNGLLAVEQSAPSIHNNYFEDNDRQGLEIRDRALLNDFRHNNINNPKARSSGGSDLFFGNSSTELQAIDNYWGSASEAEIETRIRHRVDDPALGLVRFVPFATSPFPIPEDIGYENSGGNGNTPLFRALTSGNWGKWKILNNHLRGMR